MSHDPGLSAFYRLLADAHHGGQSKVDAIVALAQRTVHVVPWPGAVEGYRQLVNSDGLAALPIFTSFDQLGEAAHRYGWLDASGQPAAEEIGARAALNYAVDANLTFVVVDIASDHALEMGADEFRPLLKTGRRDSSGPYAAAGKISSTMIAAVRPSNAPPPRSAIEPPRSSPGIDPGPPPSTPELQVSTDFDPNAKVTFGGGSGVAFSKLGALPSDALFDALTSVMRGFPEVEWACAVAAARGPTQAVPAIGVRVDRGFRQRVNELMTELRRTGDAHGASLDVMLLDDADLMRQARAQGTVFYPWRKK